MKEFRTFHLAWRVRSERCKLFLVRRLYQAHHRRFWDLSVMVSLKVPVLDSYTSSIWKLDETRGTMGNHVEPVAVRWIHWLSCFRPCRFSTLDGSAATCGATCGAWDGTTTNPWTTSQLHSATGNGAWLLAESIEIQESIIDNSRVDSRVDSRVKVRV